MFNHTTLQSQGFQLVNDPSDTDIVLRKTTCVEDLPYSHMHLEGDEEVLGTSLAHTEVLRDGTARLRIPSAGYFESYAYGEEAEALVMDAVNATTSTVLDLMLHEDRMLA